MISRSLIVCGIGAFIAFATGLSGLIIMQIYYYADCAQVRLNRALIML